MKQSLLFTLLSLSILFTTKAEASAVIVCDAEAIVTAITGTVIKVKVQSVKYGGGHSAGQDCGHLKNAEPEIKFDAAKKPNVKVGDTIKVSHQTVYNWRRDGDKVIPLVFRDWSITGN